MIDLPNIFFKCFDEMKNLNSYFDNPANNEKMNSYFLESILQLTELSHKVMRFDEEQKLPEEDFARRLAFMTLFYRNVAEKIKAADMEETPKFNIEAQKFTEIDQKLNREVQKFPELAIEAEDYMLQQKIYNNQLKSDYFDTIHYFNVVDVEELNKNHGAKI